MDLKKLVVCILVPMPFSDLYHRHTFERYFCHLMHAVPQESFMKEAELYRASDLLSGRALGLR